MSELVPKPKKLTVEQSLENLVESSHKLEPLQVVEHKKWGVVENSLLMTPQTIATAGDFKQGVEKFSQNKTSQGLIAGLGAGLGLDVLLTPLFFINDALIYSVGVPVPAILGALGLTYGYRKSKFLKDKAKRFFLRRYINNVSETIKSVYGKKFTDDDVEMMAAIITGLERNKSGQEFTDITDGRTYRLTKGANSSWQLVHGGMWGVSIKAQEALDTVSGAVTTVTSSALGKIKKFNPLSNSSQFEDEDQALLKTVEDKVQLLLNIPLTVEDEYRVEKASRDIEETVHLANQLQKLKDATYRTSFVESLNIVDTTLNEITGRYQDAIRSEFLAEREKYSRKNFKLK